LGQVDQCFHPAEIWRDICHAQTKSQMLASSAIQTKLEGQIITQKANLNAGGPQKDLQKLYLRISTFSALEYLALTFDIALI
jgi:hypothetical protein